MIAVLKACPFCGTYPEGPHKDGGSDERTGYNFFMRVTCSCGATISRPSHHNKQGWCDDIGHAERDVIKAWNARAAMKPKCRGVAHPGCNYLAACGTVCNKCGQVVLTTETPRSPVSPLSDAR